MNAQDIGIKIQKVRALRGYTQEYMAEKLGLTGARQYARYERGEARLTVMQVNDIAKVLGLSLIELLAFEEDACFRPRDSERLSVVQNAYIQQLQEEVKFLRAQLGKGLG